MSGGLPSARPPPAPPACCRGEHCGRRRLLFPRSTPLPCTRGRAGGYLTSFLLAWLRLWWDCCFRGVCCAWAGLAVAITRCDRPNLPGARSERGPWTAGPGTGWATWLGGILCPGGASYARKAGGGGGLYSLLGNCTRAARSWGHIFADRLQRRFLVCSARGGWRWVGALRVGWRWRWGGLALSSWGGSMGGGGSHAKQGARRMHLAGSHLGRGSAWSRGCRSWFFPAAPCLL